MPITESPDIPTTNPVAAKSYPCPGHGFHRRAWFDMLARHCFSGANCLWPRAEADGHALILPLVDDGERLDALANYYSFSYGPIIEGAPSADQVYALVRRIAGQLRGRRGRVSFYPLFDEDGAAQMMRRAFASAGWIAVLTDQSVNHIVDLKGRSFAKYWAARPGPLRSSVRRKGRTRPYAFVIHDRLTEGLWQDYLAVYAASWKNAEPWPGMVRAIAEEAASRGALRLGTAQVDDRIAAAQIWTIEGGTACIHKIAHDSAEDRKSPGTLLSHHMFAHMIDHEKVSRIDYGTGNNAYKRDWMEQERPMLRLDCFDPRRAAMWLPALKTRISQLVRRSGGG